MEKIINAYFVYWFFHKPKESKQLYQSELSYIIVTEPHSPKNPAIIDVYLHLLSIS